MTMPKRQWVDMTTYDFDRLDPERTVAVLPVGAIEQHGPHLPVYVDACIVTGMIEHVVKKLPDDLPVTVLPIMPIGKSNEHLAFKGTLSFGAETLIRMWTEIGECVHRAGIRKLLLLNSHGGQPQIMDIVGRDLRVRLGMMVVAANYWSVGRVEGIFKPEEYRFGIHGGSGETSVMMYLRPDLVRDDKRQNFVNRAQQVDKDYKYLKVHGSTAISWQVQDLNDLGACGDATDADAARGRKIVEETSTKLVELLKEISRYPLSNIHLRTP